MHTLGEQHVGDGVVVRRHGPQHLLQLGLRPVGADPADERIPLIGRTGEQRQQLHAVDDVTGRHRLDRLLVLVVARLQRCLDAQRHGQVGEPRVAQPPLDAVADEGGDRLPGGDALEQGHRLAHAERAEVELEGAAAGVGLTAAAQDGRGDGMDERRGEHVPEALGAAPKSGGGPPPSRSTEVDAGRPSGALARQS